MVQNKLNCQILVRSEYSGKLVGKMKNLVAVSFEKGFGIFCLMILVYFHPEDD